MGLVLLKVEAVAVDWKGSPVVVLREKGGQRAVFIWIGLAEASAISWHLEGQKQPRPLTHDLIVLMLSELGAAVDRVVITDMRHTTYFADLIVTVGDRSISLDCRPSDAIAVAVRVDAPLYIGEELLERLEKARQEEEVRTPQSSDFTIVDSDEPTVH